MYNAFDYYFIEKLCSSMATLLEKKELKKQKKCQARGTNLIPSFKNNNYRIKGFD